MAQSYQHIGNDCRTHRVHDPGRSKLTELRQVNCQNFRISVVCIEQTPTDDGTGNGLVGRHGELQVAHQEHGETCAGEDDESLPCGLQTQILHGFVASSNRIHHFLLGSNHLVALGQFGNLGNVVVAAQESTDDDQDSNDRNGVLILNNAGSNGRTKGIGGIVGTQRPAHEQAGEKQQINHDPLSPSFMPFS